MSPRHDICSLFNIKYPIVQAGMVWVSGAKLAAAAANAGCLGLIGAGSMSPELLDHHIKKAQKLAPGKSLGVNLPLLYSKIEEQIKVCLDNNIKYFFTSAGSPKKYTSFLKEKGAVVVHVTSSPLLAKKCEDAGVDAVVAEGFEAGGHNGKDELTTMTLIPQVVDTISLPVIAAGGIADARQMAAALCLGANGVQVGSRFMMTKESSAHDHYKKLLQDSPSNATELCMKDLVAVRLVKNEFYKKVKELENNCATKDELKNLLGKGRAKKGMLEGDLIEGELEAGQVVGMLNDLPTANDYVKKLISELNSLALQFSYPTEGES
jgi:enoyl-[acyl-carrier protein] reductase II